MEFGHSKNKVILHWNLASNFQYFAKPIFCFVPRYVDRRKRCQLRSAVSRLSHRASTYVYNTFPWRRASHGSSATEETCSKEGTEGVG